MHRLSFFVIPFDSIQQSYAFHMAQETTINGMSLNLIPLHSMKLFNTNSYLRSSI